MAQVALTKAAHLHALADFRSIVSDEVDAGNELTPNQSQVSEKLNNASGGFDWHYDIDALLIPLIANHEFKWDDNMRAALAVFVERMPRQLSQADLSKLRQIIQDKLNGDEGAYLAEVVVSLYELGEMEAGIFGQKVPPTMEAMLEQHVSREEYRRSYLGMELYGDYYGAEVADMDADMAHSKGLDSKIKELRKQGASDEEVFWYLYGEEGLLAAEAFKGMERTLVWWHQRYERFMDERQLIDDAGLALRDKAALIEELLRNHYQANEIEAAKSYIAMQESLVGG